MALLGQFQMIDLRDDNQTATVNVHIGEEEARNWYFHLTP